MDIISELEWRGLTHQITDLAGLRTFLSGGPRAVYAGFDPTSDSLHVGSLLPLMLLRRFQRAGHKPIALVGGATGMIGDPSGKSEERNLLSAETLAKNVAGLRDQMQAFLYFGPNSNLGNTAHWNYWLRKKDSNEALAIPEAVLVNNEEWMSGFSFLSFLRDVGKHAPVSVMLTKDSVKSRLERGDGGLSYTEFSYMLLQAYDFVSLYDRQGCQVQIGGSDQWGNITAGIDLGRRMRGAQFFGLTCPLLTKSDGAKMGKTESGAVWLSAEKTSPYKFYQYWVNIDDADAGKSLRFLTELGREEIEALDAARAAEPQKRESQKRLAEELTRLVHGEAVLASARRATEILFGAEIADLSDAQLSEIFADVPSRDLPRGRLAEGLTIVDALAEAGLAKSKGEARRVVEQGGAYVNNRRATGIDYRLSESDLVGQGSIVLRAGKKNYALLRLR